MFYFLITPILTYNAILIAAAVIPAALLLWKVYSLDKLEHESRRMLWQLIKAGIFSSLIALVEERVLSSLLDIAVYPDTVLYNVILYFGIVAFAEESSKYLMLYKSSWNSPEYNCLYDGVVYAVFVSLGFALWENISYVMHYGFSTALVRALTAIPGHTCFGVFMGVFYGIARKYENRGMKDRALRMKALAVLVPALLHGSYDYIASVEVSAWFFVGFIALLFAASYMMVNRMSKKDRYI